LNCPSLPAFESPQQRGALSGVNSQPLSKRPTGSSIDAPRVSSRGGAVGIDLERPPGQHRFPQ
jgi:hypothetical protein